MSSLSRTFFFLFSPLLPISTLFDKMAGRGSSSEIVADVFFLVFFLVQGPQDDYHMVPEQASDGGAVEEAAAPV